MNKEYPQTGLLAYVFLERENDEQNKCLLTHSEIFVVRKGRTSRFSLKDIRSLSFTSKVLLLPIVTGGAFGPFFFIALLGDYFPPVFSLSGFLLSIFLFYYGFAGKQALKIELHNDISELFLSKISDNLKSFVGFANDFIARDMKTEGAFDFYIPISEEEKTALQKEGRWILDEKGVFGFTARDFNAKLTSGYLKVDLKKENLEVKFEKGEDGTLRPKLYGQINADNHFNRGNS